MRRPASRPQLKRDPLGGSNGRQHFGGSMRLTAVLAAAVALVGALPTLVAQAPGQTAQVGPQADSTLRHWLRQLVVSQRSEEHTSELQSHHDLVCRLLLEKKKTKIITNQIQRQ